MVPSLDWLTCVIDSMVLPPRGLLYDGHLGEEEAQELQERVREGLSQAVHHDPFYLVADTREPFLLLFIAHNLT